MSQIKLAHIFVHFFKVGGGEAYLSKFSYKSACSFYQTIFINKNHKNETLFHFYSTTKIIFYDGYIDLNKELIKNNYDIIIDHQLYWFDINYAKVSFLNIDLWKIIRIIHGVPIHHINILPYEFYYTVELYNDINSHNSWNNHIKIYNNLGVKKNKKDINVFSENKININIAIVGRMNEEKIPVSFLKILKYFLSNYTYKSKYFFHFYGELDNSYIKTFMKYTYDNQNIFYHGIIHPENINTIYLNNDILIHPSKMEAGATVVLEAMSFGLPVICRNTTGLENALGKDSEYLCRDDTEIFKKLIKINSDNYHHISKRNILKVENENNEDILAEALQNEIKLIHKLNTLTDSIPNIIHYVFGLEKQIEEFPFVYYLSILSNYLINKPLAIYFHYQHLPNGKWWDKIKNLLKLNFINTDNIFWGKKKIMKFAHKADKIRLEMLYKYGGVYMDIDTITYKPYHHLLKYDFVIGIQEENYGEDKITLYGNAILFSRKNNIFIKKWMDKYEEYFDPNGWCEASIHLPHTILLDHYLYSDSFHILEKEALYVPSYNEVDKIFEKEYPINDSLLTLHLWNSFSNKYYKDIKDFDWILKNNSNSLYSSLIKNLIDNYSIHI
jgi:glycosyltransferase involved in cell wall biosynthesis